MSYAGIAAKRVQAFKSSSTAHLQKTLGKPLDLNESQQQDSLGCRGDLGHIPLVQQGNSCDAVGHTAGLGNTAQGNTAAQLNTSTGRLLSGSPCSEVRPRQANCRHFSRRTLSTVISQQPSLFDGRRISAVEKCVTSITLLPAPYTTITVLYLSKNLLSSLEGIQQFQSLRVVSLADNLLEDFSALEPLQSLLNLEAITLNGNPLSRFPNYRAQVISTLTSLKSLDAASIGPEEGRTAVAALQHEAMVLELMLANVCLLHKLERGIQLMQVHTELLGLLFCGQKAVFWSSLPQSPSTRAANLLRVWDYQGLLSNQEKAAIMKELRTEVSQLYTRALVQAKRDPKAKAVTSWEHAFAEVLMRQQEEVVSQAGVFEGIRTLADRALQRLTGTRVGECREGIMEDSAARTASMAADRERIIIEFRENLEHLLNVVGENTAGDETQELQHRFHSLQAQMQSSITQPLRESAVLDTSGRYGSASQQQPETAAKKTPAADQDDSVRREGVWESRPAHESSLYCDARPSALLQTAATAGNNQSHWLVAGPKSASDGSAVARRQNYTPIDPKRMTSKPDVPERPRQPCIGGPAQEGYATQKRCKDAGANRSYISSAEDADLRSAAGSAATRMGVAASSNVQRWPEPATASCHPNSNVTSARGHAAQHSAASKPAPCDLLSHRPASYLSAALSRLKMQRPGSALPARHTSTKLQQRQVADAIRGRPCGRPSTAKQRGSCQISRPQKCHGLEPLTAADRPMLTGRPRSASSAAPAVGGIHQPCDAHPSNSPACHGSANMQHTGGPVAREFQMAQSTTTTPIQPVIPVQQYNAVVHELEAMKEMQARDAQVEALGCRCLLRRVLYSFKGMTMQQQILRENLAALDARRQSRGLKFAHAAWQGAVALCRLPEPTAEQLVQADRFCSAQHTRATFGAWRTWILSYARPKMANLLKARRQPSLYWLSATLAAWRMIASRSCGRRSQLSTALAHFATASSQRALLAWQIYHRQQRQYLALRARAHGRTVLHMFCVWRLFVHLAEHHRVSSMRAYRHAHHKALIRVFAGWSAALRQLQEQDAKAVSIRMRRIIWRWRRHALYTHYLQQRVKAVAVLTTSHIRQRMRLNFIAWRVWASAAGIKQAWKAARMARAGRWRLQQVLWGWSHVARHASSLAASTKLNRLESEVAALESAAATSAAAEAQLAAELAEVQQGLERALALYEASAKELAYQRASRQAENDAHEQIRQLERQRAAEQQQSRRAAGDTRSRLGAIQQELAVKESLLDSFASPVQTASARVTGQAGTSHPNHVRPPRLEGRLHQMSAIRNKQDRLVKEPADQQRTASTRSCSAITDFRCSWPGLERGQVSARSADLTPLNHSDTGHSTSSSDILLDGGLRAVDPTTGCSSNLSARSDAVLAQQSNNGSQNGSAPASCSSSEDLQGGTDSMQSEPEEQTPFCRGRSVGGSTDKVNRCSLVKAVSEDVPCAGRSSCPRLSFIGEEQLSRLLRSVNDGHTTAQEAQLALLGAVQGDQALLRVVLKGISNDRSRQWRCARPWTQQQGSRQVPSAPLHFDCDVRLTCKTR